MAKDPVKDQTYFLSLVQREKFEHTLFPLGSWQKSELKARARSAGLPNADRRESMGICFIGKKHFPSFIASYLPPKPGNYVELSSNRVIGQHEGHFTLTRGQRARISGQPSAFYVVDKDPRSGDVFVVASPQHPALFSAGLVTQPFNWLLSPDSQAETSMSSLYSRLIENREPVPLFCKLKSQHLPMARCVVRVSEQDPLEVHVSFPEAQRAVTPGQVVALYDKESAACVGGGVIQTAISSETVE